MSLNLNENNNWWKRVTKFVPTGILKSDKEIESEKFILHSAYCERHLSKCP